MNMILLTTDTVVHIFGIKIQEPVTTFTDLIVSVVCFIAFIRLLKINRIELHFKLITWFFLSMGIATTFGGLIGHGFIYLFQVEWSLPEWFTNFFSLKFVEEADPVSPWKLPGWLTSMLSISLLERASIEYAKPLLHPKLRKTMDWANIIELLTFMTLTFSSLNFKFVEIHSAFGLLVINTPLHLYVYWKSRSDGSRFMLFGLGFAITSALFFMNEWSFHRWFNYLDMSHSLMAFGAYFFYQAALRLNLDKNVKLL